MKTSLATRTLVALSITASIGLASMSHAATWQGGDGNWTDPAKWDLGGNADDYPGSTTWPAEGATLTNAGEILIQAGDSIVVGGVVYSNAATIRQTGATAVFNSRLDIRTRLDLLGGEIAGNTDGRVSGGGVWYIDGGAFGTRITGGPPTGGGVADSKLTFMGSGNGTVTVTENGILDVHTLDMSQLSGGDALIEFYGVVDRYDRSALFQKLYKSSTGTSATVRFVFSSEGIQGLTSISNNGTNLGTGADRGLLEVDVTDYTSDGTEAFTLFDYSGTLGGDGTFGGITLMDNGEAYSAGLIGSLDFGQYALDYADGDGTDIVLYFKSIPEPASFVLLTLGSVFLSTRRRRR